MIYFSSLIYLYFDLYIYQYRFICKYSTIYPAYIRTIWFRKHFLIVVFPIPRYSQRSVTDKSFLLLYLLLVVIYHPFYNNNLLFTYLYFQSHRFSLQRHHHQSQFHTAQKCPVQICRPD